MRQCIINIKKNERRKIFLWLLLLLFCGMPATTSGQDSISISSYDRRVNRMRHYWASLIPTQFVIQNAGNMGLVSVTNTLKQNYIPWSVSFNNVVSLEPLLSSVYLNTVYGHEFWRSQPGRYPDKYYEALSTKFRLNVAVGQQLTFSFNPEKTYFKRVKLFYEIGSCDLYIRSLFMGTDISFWDILGLSLGIKLEML